MISLNKNAAECDVLGLRMLKMLAFVPPRRYYVLTLRIVCKWPDCFCRFHHSFGNGPKGSPTESAHVSEDGGRNPRKRKELHESSFGSLWSSIIRECNSVQFVSDAFN